MHASLNLDIIGTGDGLPFVRRKAIVWTNMLTYSQKAYEEKME